MLLTEHEWQYALKNYPDYRTNAIEFNVAKIDPVYFYKDEVRSVWHKQPFLASPDFKQGIEAVWTP